MSHLYKSDGIKRSCAEKEKISNSFHFYIALSIDIVTLVQMGNGLVTKHVLTSAKESNADAVIIVHL